MILVFIHYLRCVFWLVFYSCGANDDFAIKKYIDFAINKGISIILDRVFLQKVFKVEISELIYYEKNFWFWRKNKRIFCQGSE